MPRSTRRNVAVCLVRPNRYCANEFRSPARIVLGDVPRTGELDVEGSIPNNVGNPPFVGDAVFAFGAATAVFAVEDGNCRRPFWRQRNQGGSAARVTLPDAS